MMWNYSLRFLSSIDTHYPLVWSHSSLTRDLITKEKKEEEEAFWSTWIVAEPYAVVNSFLVVYTQYKVNTHESIPFADCIKKRKKKISFLFPVE